MPRARYVSGDENRTRDAVGCELRLRTPTDRVSHDAAVDPEHVPRHLYPGLMLLLQARQYARQLARDEWDFAVEMGSLGAVGLTNNDFRWLVVEGWVTHAQETTGSRTKGREFRPSGHLTFPERSCFVLTERGSHDARSFCQSVDANDLPVCLYPPAASHGFPTVSAGGQAVFKPNWDSDRHQLTVGGLLVKEFKAPSANQEKILMAFEEEAWPPHIDDPLPGVSGLDPKRRLHDAIKGLNRHQKRRLIQFMGDGSGEGIRWEPVLSAADGRARKKRRRAK